VHTLNEILAGSGHDKSLLAIGIGVFIVRKFPKKLHGSSPRCASR
jgi:hypothetical protein